MSDRSLYEFDSNVNCSRSLYLYDGCNGYSAGFTIAASTSTVTTDFSGSTMTVADSTSDNTDGVSNIISRVDHSHAHGALSNPSLHAVVTETANGFMSYLDKQRIDNSSRGSYGNGNDGNVMINSETVLFQDKYYNNLTVNGSLYTNGYRIFVSNLLTLNGTIYIDGNIGTDATISGGSAIAGVGGAGGTNGTIANSITNGGNGNAINNSSVNTDSQADGYGGQDINVGYGGAGIRGTDIITGSIDTSTSSSQDGGSVFFPTVNNGYINILSALPNAVTDRDLSNNIVEGGASGGGGSVACSIVSGGPLAINAAGGGGGSGAGVAVVSAYQIIGDGLISAIGGNGGNGIVVDPPISGNYAIGASGGGGGGGGIVIVICGTTLVSTVVTSTENVLTYQLTDLNGQTNISIDVSGGLVGNNASAYITSSPPTFTNYQFTTPCTGSFYLINN